MFFPQISDDEEDEMCSDMNNLSQNDKSDSSSIFKREFLFQSGLGFN